VTQTIEECRTILASDVAQVLVEAPAGCGKTYEAVRLGCAVAARLQPYERVLLLTHTNAARNEFDQRSGERPGGSRVRISTLDAFFLEICTPYTTPLDLPASIKSGIDAGTVTFGALAAKALELMRRAPSIAVLIGSRYPFIILDEHQDASASQHDCIIAIAAASGARLRFFGDSMQAIYEFAGGMVSFEDLAKTVDARCELFTPWRWRENKELGEWILKARAALAICKPLPIGAAPKSVTIERVGTLADPGYARHYDVALLAIVRRFGNYSNAVVLARTNAQAEALDKQTAGLFSINEGSDFQMARDFLRDITTLAGRKKQMAERLVKLIVSTSIGFDTARREQVSAALLDDEIVVGRKKQATPILRAAKLIYGDPSVGAACRAVGEIIDQPPLWIKRFTKPQNLALIGCLGAHDDGHDVALEAAITHERQLRKKNERTVGTIHKAKGCEYHNVLIWNFSDVDFPISEDAARLAYVAVSRAIESLIIVAPGAAVSPWLWPSLDGFSA
jgi:hypothetical protein